MTIHQSAPSIIRLPAPSGPHPIGRTSLELVDEIPPRDLRGATPNVHASSCCGSGTRRRRADRAARRATCRQHGRRSPTSSASTSPGVRTHAIVDAPVAGDRRAIPGPAAVTERLLTAAADRPRRAARQRRLRRGRRQPHVRDGRHRLRRRPHRADESGRARRRPRTADRSARRGLRPPRRGLRVQGQPTSARWPITSPDSSPAPTGPGADRPRSRPARRVRALVRRQRRARVVPSRPALPGRRQPRRRDLDRRRHQSASPARRCRSSPSTPSSRMPGADAVAAGIAPDAAWYEAERSIAFDGWRTVSRLARPGHTMQITGATHISFMDLPFLPLQRRRPGRLDARRDAASTPSGCGGSPATSWPRFFDRHLRGNAATELDDPRRDTPRGAPREPVTSRAVGADPVGPVGNGRPVSSRSHAV